ncbi:MAG: phage-shock protein [Desulfobacterales bacterium]|nr:phage-shock protein [Desulfobacterales bacterium]
MHGALMLATIFGGTILVLAIIGSTILMGIKILKGGASRSDQKMQSDEAKVIQGIYQGLSRMEKRVGALETLIFDHEKKEKES